MKVEKISATIRYSLDTGKGAWKVIELGAEASVSDGEHWKQAQSELYYQLGDQLRQLWHNGTGAALNGAESPVEPPAAPKPTDFRHGDTGATPIIWSGSAGLRTGQFGTATGREGAGAASQKTLNKGGEKLTVAQKEKTPPRR